MLFVLQSLGFCDFAAVTNNIIMLDSIVIGWIAVLIAVIGFGSYAVPIKGEAANSVAVDPLVMQSYKSFMCFVTSWFVLLNNNGQEVSFTYWGIVSGLFWVPAGT